MADLLRLSLSENFGEANVQKLESLVFQVAQGVQGTRTAPAQTLADFLPQGALCLLGAAVQAAAATARATEANYINANVCAIIKAFIGPTSWTKATAADFGQRLLQAPEAAFSAMTDPGSKDYAALRFLAEVVQGNFSASEVAAALLSRTDGQQWLENCRSSPTYGQLVLFASYSIWDSIWNWLKGAAQWVKDAVETFGEWASKAAKAVVDSVFARFPALTKFLEQIPVVGLLVAGIYAAAGDRNSALAALAINMNATVTFICTAVGSAVGGPAGGMLGGAVGKAAGLLIQKAIAGAITDSTLKAEVGDISAVKFVVEVALAGAVPASASEIGTVLAKEAGKKALQTFLASKTLSALLATLPAYFIPKDV